MAQYDRYIQIEGDMMMLSGLGMVLWENYKSKFFLFYCPDEVYNSINNTTEIKKIIQEDFSREEVRLNHINPEPNNHKLIYKRARSVQRIYYFYTEDNVPVIYMVFNNHDEHEKYFRSVKLTVELKKEIHENSKIRKIEIIK